MIEIFTLVDDENTPNEKASNFPMQKASTIHYFKVQYEDK